MVVIADSDGSPRAEVVKNVEVEEAHGAGVGVPLKVASNPVVTIADSVLKQSAPGVQQKTRALSSGGCNHHNVGWLFLKSLIPIEIGNAGCLPASIGENFFHHTLCP